MEIQGRRKSVAIMQQQSNYRGRNHVDVSLKKVQVVYYLSRNGQLEHPHFMELYQKANHLLKLKDVMDKLTVLRGRGMPSLFSWSCKRSYKNGYVWNDLSENDIIYPADGCEYVLKGSELFHGSSSSSSARQNPKCMQNQNHYLETEEEEEEEDQDKSNNEQTAKQQTELQLGDDDSSPPSSSSSDPAAESAPTLNSVLRQLISCGAGAGAASKKSHALRIKAVSRLALASRAEDDGEEIRRCMAENPRFIKSQGEEKEYFSGSIVEGMAASEQRSETEPRLKKSSSCNEDRSSKVGIGEAGEEEEGGGKGKCIPGRKKASKSK